MSQSLIRCKRSKSADGCPGILGSWNNGEFIPSAHLKPGRDLWIDHEGKCQLRCSFCGMPHTISKTFAEQGRIRLEVV